MKQLHFRTYDEYRRNQVEGNLSKLGKIWAREANIRYIARELVPAGARFGLCHGTRRGAEQAWFREALPGCEVWGTEISPSAEQFAYTVRWDFQDFRAEWEGRADFIYSNSHDHARDPAACLRVWIGQLKPSGVLVLEHTEMHEMLIHYNCWAVGVRELCGLLEAWSDHTREVTVHDLPESHKPKPRRCSYTKAVVLGARK